MLYNGAKTLTKNSTCYFFISGQMDVYDFQVKMFKNSNSKNLLAKLTFRQLDLGQAISVSFKQLQTLSQEFRWSMLSVSKNLSILSSRWSQTYTARVPELLLTNQL